MKIIITAILYVIFFFVIEFIVKKRNIDKEVSRKIVHIIAGISIVFLPFIMTFSEIMILTILFIPVMFFSRRINFFSSIHGIKRKTYGEVYFPMSVFLTAFFFPDKTIFTYGVLIMALSDGLASLIGQRYGKRRYKLFSSQKSYIGSLAFFVSALLIGLFFTNLFWLSILLAAILTAAEALLSKGLDNLVLPLLGSSLLLYFMRV